MTTRAQKRRNNATIARELFVNEGRGTIRPLPDLIARTGVKPSIIYYTCTTNGWPYPTRTPAPFCPGIDAMLNGTYSLADIASQNEMTRQATNTYLKQSSQHWAWLLRREAHLYEAPDNTLPIIRAAIQDLAETWEERAASICINEGYKPPRFAALHEVLRRYRVASEEGHRATREELVQGTTLKDWQLTEVLERLDYPALRSRGTPKRIE